MTLYTKRASIPLKALLDEVAKKSPSERMSLADEIDVARIICDRAIKTFDKVFFNEDPNKEISDKSKLGTMRLVQDSLEHVSRLVAQHAKVLALSDATLNTEQCGYMIDQIVKILDDHLVDQEEIYKLIVQDLNKMKLPEKKVNITIS